MQNGILLILAAVGLFAALPFLKTENGAPLPWHRTSLADMPPGALAPGVPRQVALRGAKPQSLEGFTLTPVARFETEALVLSRRAYRFDAMAPLSPVDLALGWGPMSDPAQTTSLKISQSGRFYRWRMTDTTTLGRREIGDNSANMHMIPLDAAQAAMLQSLGAGDVIELRGWLVDVSGPDGSRWRTSRTRTDFGGGACEIVLIESLRRIPATPEASG